MQRAEIKPRPHSRGHNSDLLYFAVHTYPFFFFFFSLPTPSPTRCFILSFHSPHSHSRNPPRLFSIHLPLLLARYFPPRDQLCKYYRIAGFFPPDSRCNRLKKKKKIRETRYDIRDDSTLDFVLDIGGGGMTKVSIGLYRNRGGSDIVVEYFRDRKVSDF